MLRGMVKILKVYSRDEEAGELRFDEETRKWSIHPTKDYYGDLLKELLQDPVADSNLMDKCTANSNPEKFMEYAPITYTGSGVRVARAEVLQCRRTKNRKK
jgi:hypothetical protein